MCQKSKIIARVKNGELSMCRSCENFSLTFNNILFQFDKSELMQFRDYVSKIDIDYWLTYPACKMQKRKIPVETFNQDLFLIFDEYEIEELKTLLGINTYDKQAPLSAGDIDYPFCLN